MNREEYERLIGRLPQELSGTCGFRLVTELDGSDAWNLLAAIVRSGMLRPFRSRRSPAPWETVS